MSHNETVTVKCDRCGDMTTVTVVAGPGVAEVLRAARIDEQLAEAGWLPTGGTDLCPPCTDDFHGNQRRASQPPPPHLRIVDS